MGFLHIETKKFFAIFVVLISYFSLGSPICTAEGEWQRIDSTYATIYIHPEADIRSVNNRLSIRFIRSATSYHLLPKKGVGIESEIAYKFDVIFSKAKTLLGMHPRGVHVTVRIYKTRAEIDQIYYQRFHRTNTYISYYIYEDNTIYTTEKNLNENVLAHEMAHCIIDHYFVVRPPKETEEVLAIHVDSNLKD